MMINNLKYNEFSILKNYILKDAVCDWFELQKEGFSKDKNSYYKDYIIKESSLYKKKVLERIKEYSKLNIPLKTSVKKTK